MLAGELRSRGLDVVSTREPGGTPLGRRLREAFLETEETVAPMAELLLFAADRAQHVDLLINPAINDGRIVLSDRYADASFAYQGAGRGFDEEVVTRIIELATRGLKPDLTLFFDIPVETAIERLNNRKDESAKRNRMDLETSDFYNRVRQSYLGIADREPARFKVIDASGSIDETYQKVLAIVKDMLSQENV